MAYFRSFIVALILSAALPAQAQQRTTLAVLDLQNKGVDEDLVQNLTDIITVSLNKLGVFEVLSRADIQQMLAFEEDKQMMGCESDTSCLAEIGGALGVALLVNGSIGKVGSNYIINLNLTDTRSATVKEREQRQVSDADKLTDEIERAARFLVRGLLEAQQGILILKASESGADVEIDGRIVGATPLKRMPLSGGPHTLKLFKKGFVAWARDIDIKKDEPLVVDASMVPSLEFIADYDSSAGTWRTFAYLTGGLGLAGTAFGIGGWLWNGSRTATYESDLIAANCQDGASGSPTGDCTQFVTQRQSIKSFDTVAQIAGFSGAALLAVGVFLFMEGPPPGIYDEYKGDSAASASLSILPWNDGLAAGLSWRF